MFIFYLVKMTPSADYARSKISLQLTIETEKRLLS